MSSNPPRVTPWQPFSRHCLQHHYDECAQGYSPLAPWAGFALRCHGTTAHLLAFGDMGRRFSHSCPCHPCTRVGCPDCCCVDMRQTSDGFIWFTAEHAGRQNGVGMPISWSKCSCMSPSTVHWMRWTAWTSWWQPSSCCWSVSAFRHCLQPVAFSQSWTWWSHWKSYCCISATFSSCVQQQAIESQDQVAASWILGSFYRVLWLWNLALAESSPVHEVGSRHREMAEADYFGRILAGQSYSRRWPSGQVATSCALSTACKTQAFVCFSDGCQCSPRPCDLPYRWRCTPQWLSLVCCSSPCYFLDAFAWSWWHCYCRCGFTRVSYSVASRSPCWWTTTSATSCSTCTSARLCDVWVQTEDSADCGGLPFSWSSVWPDTRDSTHCASCGFFMSCVWARILFCARAASPSLAQTSSLFWRTQICIRHHVSCVQSLLLDCPTLATAPSVESTAFRWLFCRVEALLSASICAWSLWDPCFCQRHFETAHLHCWGAHAWCHGHCLESATSWVPEGPYSRMDSFGFPRCFGCECQGTGVCTMLLHYVALDPRHSFRWAFHRPPHACLVSSFDGGRELWLLWFDDECNDLGISPLGSDHSPGHHWADGRSRLPDLYGSSIPWGLETFRYVWLAG